MFTFLHAADIHLDSPLRGLENYEGAPAQEIRGATRRAFENLVRLACERRVDFVVIAGDLFDGERDDYASALFLSRQLYRLRDAGIRLFMLAGNHDAASKMTRSLTLPDNARMLSHLEPETIDLPDLGVAIHGQGFAKSAEMRNLVAAYPQSIPGRFNVGILHTSLAGREGHEPYAPCTVTELVAKGYDYWALGHVHTREVVSARPWIVFPGNTQGRHVREPGAKGCYVVSVDDPGTARLEFVPLDGLRWEVCRVSAADCERPTELLGAVTAALDALVAQADTPLWAVRVEVTGKSPLHAELMADPHLWTNEIRARAQGVSADRLWIEKVKLLTEPVRPDVLRPDEDGPLAELLSVFAELRASDEKLRELGGEFDELRSRLPVEMDERGEALPTTADELQRLLNEVEPFLLARLNVRGTPS